MGSSSNGSNSSSKHRMRTRKLQHWLQAFGVLPFVLVLLASTTEHTNTVQAQQKPTLNSIPQYSYEHGEGFRTNVCDRQREVREGRREFRYALQGLDLSVAMTNYGNALFALDKTTGAIKEEDPGLLVVIMDEIASRAGFEWRNSFAAIVPPTSNGNNTWAELLPWEVAHFDIAADYWARSVTRMAAGVAFPHGWWDGSIVMISRAEAIEDPFQFDSFLVPFEMTVWVSIFFFIFITGMAYFILERLNPSADDRDLEDKPVAAIFLTALTFTGHYEFKPNTLSARFLTVSFSFWTLIVISAYTANMASFLVSQSSTVTRIGTIEEAITTNTPICVVRGAVMDEYLSDKYTELSLVRKPDETEMFNALKLGWYGGDGGCGAVLTNLNSYELYASQATNSDCTLGSDKRQLLNLPAGFACAADSAIECTSLLSYVFDLHLLEMRAEGFIDAAWNAHVNKLSTVECPNEDDIQDSNGSNDGSFSMTLKDLGGIFLMHFGLSLLALIGALGNYCHTRRRNPERNLRPLNIDQVITNTIPTNMKESFRWASSRKLDTKDGGRREEQPPPVSCINRSSGQGAKEGGPRIRWSD